MSEGNILRRPQSGDPFVPSAARERYLLDAAEQVHRSQGRNGGPPQLRAWRYGDVVDVRNTTGGPAPAYTPLGLGGPTFAPGDDLEAFRGAVLFDGIAPAEGQPFVVPLQPLADGEIGRAVASGVVPCQVTSSDGDAGKRWASLVGSGPAVMTAVTEPTGCEILWRAEGTGAQWALVRLSTHGKRIMTVLQLIPWGFPTAGYADVTLTLPNPDSGFSSSTDTLTLPWNCDLETWRDALLAHPAIDGHASRIDAEDGAWPASALSVKFVGPFLNRTIALPATDVSNLTGGAFPTVQAIRLLVNV